MSLAYTNMILVRRMKMMDLPHPVVGLRLLMEERIGLQLLLPWLCGMSSLVVVFGYCSVL